MATTIPQGRPPKTQPSPKEEKKSIFLKIEMKSPNWTTSYLHIAHQSATQVSQNQKKQPQFIFMIDLKSPPLTWMYDTFIMN